MRAVLPGTVAQVLLASLVASEVSSAFGGALLPTLPVMPHHDEYACAAVVALSLGSVGSVRSHELLVPWWLLLRWSFLELAQAADGEYFLFVTRAGRVSAHLVTALCVGGLLGSLRAVRPSHPRSRPLLAAFATLVYVVSSSILPRIVHSFRENTWLGPPGFGMGAEECIALAELSVAVGGTAMGGSFSLVFGGLVGAQLARVCLGFHPPTALAPLGPMLVLGLAAVSHVAARRSLERLGLTPSPGVEAASGQGGPDGRHPLALLLGLSWAAAACWVAVPRLHRGLPWTDALRISPQGSGAWVERCGYHLSARDRPAALAACAMAASQAQSHPAALRHVRQLAGRGLCEAPANVRRGKAFLHLLHLAPGDEGIHLLRDPDSSVADGLWLKTPVCAGNNVPHHAHSVGKTYMRLTLLEGPNAGQDLFLESTVSTIPYSRACLGGPTEVARDSVEAVESRCLDQAFSNDPSTLSRVAGMFARVHLDAGNVDLATEWAILEAQTTVPPEPTPSIARWCSPRWAATGAPTGPYNLVVGDGREPNASISDLAGGPLGRLERSACVVSKRVDGGRVLVEVQPGMRVSQGWMRLDSVAPLVH